MDVAEGQFGTGPVAVARGSTWRQELLRFCLVPLFVVLCYQFEWRAWREFVTTILVALAPWFGVPLVRLGFDSFICQGEFYRVVLACTALDAFCGSIPLVWDLRLKLHRNAVLLVTYLACLSVVNLLRLELGFVLYLRGVSWFLAHEAVAGVFYFALLLWIVLQRRWGVINQQCN